MGARATLIGALVVDERLWGLVFCQQKHEPKYFGPAERDAFGWLGEDVATLIRETRIWPDAACTVTHCAWGKSCFIFKGV